MFGGFPLISFLTTTLLVSNRSIMETPDYDDSTTIGDPLPELHEFVDYFFTASDSTADDNGGGNSGSDGDDEAEDFDAGEYHGDDESSDGKQEIDLRCEEQFHIHEVDSLNPAARLKEIHDFLDAMNWSKDCKWATWFTVNHPDWPAELFQSKIRRFENHIACYRRKMGSCRFRSCHCRSCDPPLSKTPELPSWPTPLDFAADYIPFASAALSFTYSPSF